MLEKLTWHPFDPAPYESSWSVFCKLLALNFCKPADIAKSIRRRECISPKYLSFRDSNWIDFDRFSDLVDVAPNRLKAGFLQELGFPQFKNQDEAHGIRFCPECLSFGYHSVLFDLALVAVCPIHQEPLQNGCTHCFNTIAHTGFYREKSPYRINDGVIHDSAWRADTYVSKCGHIRFDPERILGITRLNCNQRRDVNRVCEEFIRWWRKAFSSTNAAPGLIARLAQISYKGQDEGALGLCMDIAQKLAGECPWPTSVSPSPADWLTLRRSQENAAEGSTSIEFRSDLGTIYRSVRRHLFKKYIKPSHLVCWTELAAYNYEMSRAISIRTVCVVVLAYMSWRMSIEGFSNIEGFGLKKAHTPPSLLSFACVANTASELANFWYALFFVILGRIEAKVEAGGQFYIERPYRVTRFTGCSEFAPDINLESNSGTWYIIFPNKDHVTKIATRRCDGRSRSPYSMLNISADEKIYFMGWAGDYSSFNRSNLIFRIEDEDDRPRKAYSYIRF